MVLTEPDAGSDLGALQTQATFDEDSGEWRLNGVKRFITNGCADILLVLARSEEGSTDARGLSLFEVEADETVGRRHLPIVVGRKTSSLVYGFLLFLTYLSIVVGVVLDLLPTTSLLGLLTAVAALPTALNVYRHAENLEKLMPSLGINVLLTVATPVLVAIGLLVAP